MDKKWYSVKLIYQFAINGEPSNIDEFYCDDRDIFEESIVIVRASSFEEAYLVAEENAKNNGESFVNKYSQTVVYKFIESLDCYLLGEELANSMQIYSGIKGVEKGTGADKFIDDTLQEEFDINSKHILIKKA